MEFLTKRKSWRRKRRRRKRRRRRNRRRRSKRVESLRSVVPFTVYQDPIYLKIEDKHNIWENLYHRTLVINLIRCSLRTMRLLFVQHCCANSYGNSGSGCYFTKPIWHFR
jgi:hypothetical protein